MTPPQSFTRIVYVCGADCSRYARSCFILNKKNTRGKNIKLLHCQITTFLFVLPPERVKTRISGCYIRCANYFLISNVIRSSHVCLAHIWPNATNVLFTFHPSALHVNIRRVDDRPLLRSIGIFLDYRVDNVTFYGTLA